MNKITITPLGGLGRTGALNCMLYETAKTAILVDCGAGFVDDGYPGVDILIPNFDLLETKRDKLKAVILTHGHEDHVGGLPYLLQEICVPVYATPFTRGVITSKISEFKIKGVQLHELQPSHKIQIGDFAIEPVFIHHSIMDVVAFYITVADQKIFHCTDFKLDDSAPAQKQMDLDRFAAIGKAGVDLALLDSTNVLAEGTSESEAVIKDNLYEIFSSVPGRLIACLFSSNTYRLQSLLQCARQAGRKVALTGRSTKEYFRIAASLDRLDLAGIDFHDVEDIGQFADQEVFVIVTGSQAEPRSVLSRMSRDMFRPFKIREGDTLLMSSRMIPGNEGRILHMLNNIAQLGAHIITDSALTPVHASGHAMAADLAEVLKLLNPRYLLPIHGAYRHLCELANIAQSQGMSPENIQILTDGDVALFGTKGFEVIDQLLLEPRYVSENQKYFITPAAVKRRKKLSFNGLVVVSLVFVEKKKLSRPRVALTTEGIFGGTLELEIGEKLTTHIEHMWGQSKGHRHESIEREVRSQVTKWMKTHYDLRPEVIVLEHHI